MSKVTWTPENDERLRVLAQNHTHRQIGVIMGTTAGAVASRCRVLGVKREPCRAPKFSWTPELDQAIIAMSDEELTRVAPLLNLRIAYAFARREHLERSCGKK